MPGATTSGTTTTFDGWKWAEADVASTRLSTCSVVLLAERRAGQGMDSVDSSGERERER